MTRQIGAESTETAAWCFKFPTEAGREGILLVLCSSPVLERVHASAGYFHFAAWMTQILSLWHTLCRCTFRFFTPRIFAEASKEIACGGTQCVLRHLRAQKILNGHKVHLFRVRWVPSWSVWAAEGKKKLLRLWRRPSNRALSSRSEYQITHSYIEFCLRWSCCQFNAHSLRHTNTISCLASLLGSVYGTKLKGPVVQFNSLDLLESSLQQSQNYIHKMEWPCLEKKKKKKL